MTTKLLTVKEVGEILDLKPARIYELCREDKTFPVILIGQRQYRFSEPALLSWFENGGSRQNEVNDND